MKLKQVAAQSYTIRDYTKTAAEVASSMKKIREIGYKAVQISGMGPIDENELHSILDGEGLTCCATHENGQTILDHPEAVVQRLKKLHCKYTAYPYPAGITFDSLETVKAFAKKLEHAGEVMAKAGITLTYHNHHMEFQKIHHKTILETIYKETNPAFLQGEPDTYWIQAGGGNPLSWCQKLKGRLPLLHMKDFGLDPSNRPIYEEIGYGNLEWKKIIPAAEKSGCVWFIVEQDANWENNDPFLSLKMSFDYIQEHLVS